MDRKRRHGGARKVQAARAKRIGNHCAGQSLGRRQAPWLSNQFRELDPAAPDPTILQSCDDEWPFVEQGFCLCVFRRYWQPPDDQVDIAAAQVAILQRHSIRLRHMKGEPRILSRQRINDRGEQARSDGFAGSWPMS